jgi:GT2 family glycosyltransferase
LSNSKRVLYAGRADEGESKQVENPEPEITFCIPTLNRTACLKRSISSIRKFCPVAYSIRILSQGPPESELIRFLEELDDRIELIVSPVNLGCGGGWRLLCEGVRSPLIMVLADDMYLADDSIKYALKALQERESIGAVGMPHYDLRSSRMIFSGGERVVLRSRVFNRVEVKLNSEVDLMDVDYVRGGFIYRREMGESFSWDPRMYVFEDLDRNLQIICSGKWKQGVVPKGRLIHDHPSIGGNPKYETERYNGLAWRRAYRAFRAKWGLRFPLRSHILYELVYPGLTLTHCKWLVIAFNRFITF